MDKLREWLTDNHYSFDIVQFEGDFVTNKVIFYMLGSDGIKHIVFILKGVDHDEAY